ncbi:hypothetical protein ACP3WY_25105, partial [Salmonella enterica]|uniref:hypothetical protein n=1 Tax=Salmonella enterica TaxID=28901 RepID=UPI003CFA4C9A
RSGAALHVVERRDARRGPTVAGGRHGSSGDGDGACAMVRIVLGIADGVDAGRIVAGGSHGARVDGNVAANRPRLDADAKAGGC